MAAQEWVTSVTKKKEKKLRGDCLVTKKGKTLLSAEHPIELLFSLFKIYTVKTSHLYIIQLFSADAFLKNAHKNIKILLWKVVCILYGQVQIFQYCQLAQNQPKSNILYKLMPDLENLQPVTYKAIGKERTTTFTSFQT